MQHKRHKSKAGPLLGLLTIVIIGGVVALMVASPSAPQSPVEKELDAKAFLESKPQQ
jgi:hypothetical protein